MSENNETKEQKEIKSITIQNPWRIFAIEAFLFLLTLGLGIISAFRLKEFLKIQEISFAPISFWQFIFYFILATLFIFLITFFGKRYKKEKKFIFKAIFLFVIGWGGLIFLSLWMADLFALILVAILIFSWLKKPTILLHNLVIVFGMVGIGSSLGLRLNPLVIVAILIIFSIYDFIAVYKTKHMVKMAKEMIATGAILGLILPQKFSDFRADLKEVRVPAERVGGKFLILGGGDVVFPLLFCASLVPEGILNSLIVAFFALLGLFVSYWIFIKQKTRKPVPALPPIALLSIIGFLITRLI